MRIGIISDTHIPERCFALPSTVAQAFEGVDMIVHAGDVGELYVLDELSQIAPVFAVHGNDDTPDAQRELPLQQIITIRGQRILLWHNHYPDRIDEVMSRTDDLRPKIRRILQRAKRAGASIVIFGHWHLPFAVEEEGILLINPGTTELGSAVFRQLIQTAAVLELPTSGKPIVTHIDLADPDQPFYPHIDLDAGFLATQTQYIREFRSPELLADAARIREHFEEIVTETARMPVYRALNVAAHPVWLDKKATVAHQDWIDAIQASVEIPSDVQQGLIELLANAPV